MRQRYILIMLLSTLCAGCATSRQALKANPITCITVYPGDTKMPGPMTIQGQELKSILTDSRYQDTSYGTWLEQPLTIQQGREIRKGWLRVTSTFIPIVEIVIPYGRLWNTDYEVLMLSDVNSTKLMNMLIPAREK